MRFLARALSIDRAPAAGLSAYVGGEVFFGTHCRAFEILRGVVGWACREAHGTSRVLEHERCSRALQELERSRSADAEVVLWAVLLTRLVVLSGPVEACLSFEHPRRPYARRRGKALTPTRRRFSPRPSLTLVISLGGEQTSPLKSLQLPWLRPGRRTSLMSGARKTTRRT